MQHSKWQKKPMCHTQKKKKKNLGKHQTEHDLVGKTYFTHMRTGSENLAHFLFKEFFLMAHTSLLPFPLLPSPPSPFSSLSSSPLPFPVSSLHFLWLALTSLHIVKLCPLFSRHSSQNSFYNTLQLRSQLKVQFSLRISSFLKPITRKGEERGCAS